MQVISAILWLVGGVVFGFGLYISLYSQNTISLVMVVVGALLMVAASGTVESDDPDEYIS